MAKMQNFNILTTAAFSPLRRVSLSQNMVSSVFFSPAFLLSLSGFASHFTSVQVIPVQCLFPGAHGSFISLTSRAQEIQNHVERGPEVLPALTVRNRCLCAVSVRGSSGLNKRVDFSTWTILFIHRSPDGARCVCGAWVPGLFPWSPSLAAVMCL